MPAHNPRSGGAGTSAVDRLPAPDPETAAHSRRLVEHIRAQMDARGGRISFARFMELALYAPGLGYYAAGARKFGAAGDFVTAPEISPLFAQCLARQCREVLTALDGGSVLEFGAGSGALAADLLVELHRLDALPYRYSIVEVSPQLRAWQQATLNERVPELAARVQWLECLPDSHRGVVVANEVVDAMPVHRFRMAPEGPEQAYVAWQDDGFTWNYDRPDTQVADALEQVFAELQEPLAPGYQSELGLVGEAWVRTLGDVLEQGVAFVIDYGYPRAEYYHPQRGDGTLLCHYRHRVHGDPFLYPGLQDITASVEFTRLAEAALDAGLEVRGFTTQAHFLLGCGLEEVLAAGDTGDTSTYLARTREAKILTLPGEMGERFKVLGLGRNADIPLRGFALRDLRERL